MYVDLDSRVASFFSSVFLQVLHETVYFVVFLTIDVCRCHHRRILDSVLLCCEPSATSWQAV